MNFTLGNQKWRGSDTQLGSQRWKPTATQNVFPSNSRPYKNVDPEIENIVGPYPAPRAQSAPVTTTKVGILIRDPITGIRYPSLTFGNITCTNVGTSIPTCYKKYPRPVKVWRKQLFKHFESSSNLKPTIDQINAPGTVIQSTCKSKTNVLYTDVTQPTTKCDGFQTEKGCIGGTNAIRRAANTNINQKYCTTTREYLQKRCKTYDQNQTVGTLISGTTFKSATCSDTGNVTGDCNVIQYKPSNKNFKVQGGVSASSRTTLLKYNALNKEKQIAQKNIGLKIYKHNECFKVVDNRAVITCNKAT